MKYAPLILALVLASPAAAQPFSKSMAECAGLYAFGGDFIEHHETAHLLAFGQEKWTNAAVVQAQTEGVADAVPYVDAAMADKYAQWQARGVMAVFTEEFSDRLDYCRSFARVRVIDLNPA